VLVLVPVAQASIPTSLKSNCPLRTPHPGYSFKQCDDGTPPVAGVTPNVGGVSAVRVPAKYDGYEGLPAKAADAASMPGSDSDGMVALDVNVSIPTVPAPPGGYPMIVMMHGCCSGTKTTWESTTFEGAGERWHYNNAWFASRGYVVVNYTARGFREVGRGSTGETQLDSREFEINDYQYLAGEIADDPFFNVDPQKVVPTGGSYGGGFAWLALTDPVWVSPGGKQMKLVASAPRYGWTDLVYSLVPNGKHFLTPDRLPAFDGSDSSSPMGSPKTSILTILFASGLIGTTFPQYILDAIDCLNSADPFETNPLCTGTLATTLPSFLANRSAYYQNQFFDRIASDPSYRIPVFNAGTLTDPLFTAVENLRMSNRLQSVVPNYPIQQYFGDYEHFVQNKVREWGDICGADRHVCRFADYPLGDVNADPVDLQRTGVHTRLNRFIDHYAQPTGNASEPQPQFDVTASLQICPENAGSQPANEPGPTFTAPSFGDLAPYTLRIDRTGAQTTRNPATANPHADIADPFTNLLTNGARCPVFTTPAGPDEATYDSDPLTGTATMIGGTRVFVDYAASTADGLQINARLVDVFPDGKGVMVDRGVRRVTSQSGTVEVPLQGNGWRFEPGHKIRVEITQDDYAYIKGSSIPSSATISGVRVRMPVREPQPPALEDYKNVSKFCKAEREFFGEQAFAARYGAKNANAHGKCVSQNN
jgi:X-Pro dipeptidyl-peptidase-like protein/prolyl oligopeptidase family protein